MINPGQKMMKKSDWADLPMEILRMIMEKLFWSERLPSCLVCKTWHECFLEIQNDEQFLPWVMTMEQGGICKLGDPSKQASNIVEGAGTHDVLGFADACASRYGWVLFLNNLNDHDQYILYSPFTNEVIKLPILIKDYTSKATFSHSPGSPNCMVIVFSAKNRKISIKTCQPGDKSWKIFEFKGDKVNIIGQVACVGDFVYCFYSDDGRKLGAFNIKQQELKVSSGILPMNTNPFNSLFVAFNGDILLHSFSSNKSWSDQYWRFDLSEDKWVVVEDEIMKKHVIFEGCTSFTVPAVRDARQSAGMVYSFNDYLSDFSCLPFHADLTLRGPEVRHHRWLNGDYKWLKKDYMQLDKIWIQPPFQRIWR